MTRLGYKTRYGNTEWHDTAVLGIIKNEEYKISKEVFEKAQAILSRRGVNRRGVEKGKREKYSRKFAFSSNWNVLFAEAIYLVGTGIAVLIMKKLSGNA